MHMYHAAKKVSMTDNAHPQHPNTQPELCDMQSHRHSCMHCSDEPMQREAMVPWESRLSGN